MCYSALLSGDVDRPVGDLLRGELLFALRNGAMAGVIVVAVLLAQGGGLGVTAGAALGATALGFLVHQVLFAAGVTVLRWRGAGSAGSPA